MIKTTLYLDDATASAIRRIAQSEARSQAEVIREALARYAETAPPPLPQGMGKYRSGRRDVSEKAEQLLRQRARKRR